MKAQPECSIVPIAPGDCNEVQEPTFPGGNTLCELNSSFTPDYTIQNGTLASNLSLTLWPENSTAFTNKKILIQGIFYLNIPVAFNNCIIKLAPGAQIIVGNSGFGTPTPTEILSLRTKYFSCETMWKGIVVKSGNKARFFWSSIEDAQYAITVGNHVSLSLYGNTFNRNFVSITNDVNASTLPFLLFKKNSFTCTSALHDFFNLEFPNIVDIDPVSFAGILLLDCTSSIGHFGAQNRFRHLAYGIASRNSAVSVKGCEFYNVQSGIVIPDLLEAVSSISNSTGILKIGGELFVKGNTGNISSIFNSGAGIITRGADCFVSFATFEDCGISSSDNYASQFFSVRNNIFASTALTLSIAVERSMASGQEAHTDIFNNIISEESPLSRTIFIVGKNEPTDFAYITNNIIYFEGEDMNGIEATVFRSENLYIEDNTITFTGEECSNGIYTWIGTTEGSHVSLNTISGTSFNNNIPSTGIKNFTVRGLEYCGNTISDLGIGMSYLGNCDNSHITQNFLGEQGVSVLGIGLHVKGTQGVIGIQRGTRNVFLNPASQYGEDLAAQYESSADVIASAYLVTNADSSNLAFNPNPTFIDPQNGWFQTEGDENLTCNEGSILFITLYDSLAINSDASFELLPSPLKFYTEKNLLTLLLSNDNWSDDYDDYLLSKSGSPEYVLATIENQLHKAYKMNIEAEEELDSLINVERTEFNRLLAYDTYNYANIDSATFSFGRGLDSLIAILDRVQALTDQRFDIREIRMNELILSLSEIQDSLDLFSPATAYETYYKTIYTKRIKEISEGHLDAADYEDLIAIAQDDTDSSLANITALAMFDLCGDFTIPMLTVNESSSTVRKRNMIDPSASNDILSQNDNVISREGKVDQHEIEVHIYDLSGRLVSYHTKDSSYDDIQQYEYLVPGLYFRVGFNERGLRISSSLIPVIR